MKMKQLTVAMITLLLTASCSEKQQDYPFRNPDLPLEERIDDLLSRLTPEEKIGQMMNVTPAIERLGIPTYDWWNEALHGVARAGRATVFPQAIAMAATFDDNAVHETFTMVSDEARAKYHQYQKDKEYDRYKGLTFWTPNINIFRDPRWGRGMETYGEDPYLTEKMGVAVTRGLQGDDPKYYKTHACAKHYAVHSGPEWNRHEFNAEATPRDLYETYLPAFEALVKEGDVQEVMCAYNRFEGKPCCSSDKLLIDILRNSWGYDNIILSDCGAIDDFWRKDKNTPRHETHPDAESASADAVLNGTDLECGGSYRALNKALADGKISEKDLDVSLRRLLKGRFELGMFDPDERVPYSKIPYSVVESPEHIAKALDMARKSIVLLKNKNNMLPLDKNIKKIAVVGPNAADSTMLWANYNGFPTKTVTIVEGIRNKVPNAEVIYELGCNHTADFVVTDLGSHVSSTAGQGFASEFFNNTEFEGTPAYKGLAKELHYTTGGNTQFAPNVNLTNFTARFTGEFESPIDGPVEFKLSGNDAFRLYIDTAKVAEVWENEYGAEKLYTLNAKKGEKYPIKIEYMQRTGSADLNFTVGVRTPVDFQATASKVKDADVIVFVGGISPRLEGEEMPVDAEGFRKGDRTNIEIPAVQKEMVKALVATGKPVVYVVCTGSALALNWENQLATFDQTLYMGCNDLTSAKYISEKCGKVTISVLNNQMPMMPLFSPVYSSTRPYSQTRSNTQRDLMNPDEVLRLENRKCLALFKGHKPALLYKMTPEELPDYAGLTTCRVIDYIPEWRRNEAETAPQKRPQAPAQKEPSNIPKPPDKEKQPDHSEQPPAYDLAEDDEIGMVECTVESICGL